LSQIITLDRALRSDRQVSPENMRWRERVKAILVAVGLLATVISMGGSQAEAAGSGVIGTPAPEFRLKHWINSKALEPADMRGHVVLVRWWTDTCPFCSTTAPVLRELQSKYEDEGLQIVGIFHPKPAGDESLKRLATSTERFKFKFPVALDSDWSALKRWWLDHEPRGWTSVSFILDKKGVIRYVHEGGEFHSGPGGSHIRDHDACNQQFIEIDHLIATLIKE
jgi:peroxiredoxin